MDSELADQQLTDHRLRTILLSVAIAGGVAATVLAIITLVSDLRSDTMNFSMDPILHPGIDKVIGGPATAPAPVFNLTFHAKNHQKHRYCGQDTVGRVAYSNVVIGKAPIGQFCVEHNEEKVLTATASPGWLALPSAFQQQMESDRRAGGVVEMEVDVMFRNQAQGSVWVHCRMPLDAKQTSPCKLYSLMKFNHWLESED